MDELEQFYKVAIGSPVALFGFIIFIVTLVGVYLLLQLDNPGVLIQTYFIHYVGPFQDTIDAVLTVISMALIVLIVYVFIRTKEVDNSEYLKYKSIDIEAEEVKEHDVQWEVVRNHLTSDNPAEWRIAVLEADAMLEDAIERVGATGDTLGEKLKSLDKSSFQSLNMAWDAHKVRNMIAHEGMNFQLTQREAKRVIDLFEQALKELKYI